MTKNLRKFERKPIKGKTEVSPYQVFDYPLFEKTTSIDLSEKGIGFLSTYNYQPGDVAMLSVELPKLAKGPKVVAPIKVSVRVRWSQVLKSAGNKKTYRIGAELIEVDREDEKRFKNYLSKK